MSVSESSRREWQGGPNVSPSDASHRTFLRTRTFGSLDGLRCLSIVAVVWHHSGAASGARKYVPAADYGFLGVDLFFEISGFLIVTLLLRERRAKGAISLKGFYARRVLRIFPLYYAWLGALAVLYFALRPHSANAAEFRHDLTFAAVYLSNWFHLSGLLAITWSLSAEEQFYLVWPGIEKWLGKWAPLLFCGGILVSEVIQLGLVDGFLRTWFGWSTAEPPMLRETTFTPILLGVALAHVLNDARGHAYAARWLGRAAVPAVALALLVVYCNVLPPDIRGWPRLLVHVLMLVLLAGCVIREDHALQKLLTWRPIARIGAVSYGMYLLHQLAIGLVVGVLGARATGAASFVLGLALSVAVAELSFRKYESPFLRLKSRLSLH
jgi:peptidoglycan/LPS O-acetylase OafA/YrhL